MVHDERDGPPRAPLDYSTPSKEYEFPDPARPASIILGLIAGVAGTILTGCAGISFLGHASAAVGRWTMVATMLALSIACWVFLVVGNRTGRSRWFLIGLLIGAGFMGLIEGVCFISLS